MSAPATDKGAEKGDSKTEHKRDKTHRKSVIYCSEQSHAHKEDFKSITLLLYAREMKDLAEEVADKSGGKVVLGE